MLLSYNETNHIHGVKNVVMENRRMCSVPG